MLLEYFMFFDDLVTMSAWDWLAVLLSSARRRMLFNKFLTFQAHAVP